MYLAKIKFNAADKLAVERESLEYDTLLPESQKIVRVLLKLMHGVSVE